MKGEFGRGGIQMQDSGCIDDEDAGAILQQPEMQAVRRFIRPGLKGMRFRGQRCRDGWFFSENPEQDHSCQQEHQLDDQSVFMKKTASTGKEIYGGSQQDHSPDNAHGDTFYVVLINPEFSADEKVYTGNKHANGDKNPCDECQRLR